MGQFSGRAITIVCTDLEQSQHFYINILGAVLLPREIYICPWLKLGDLTLTLVPNAEYASPATFPDHAMSMLWLEVENLQQAYQYLKQSGCPIIEYDEELFMIITDPDGLVIESWQREAK